MSEIDEKAAFDYADDMADAPLQLRWIGDGTEAAAPHQDRMPPRS